MQTFLPYADFKKCAEVLDYRRLGKQRIECLQIFKTIIKKYDAIVDQFSSQKKIGWANHPAVLMWQGYETALLIYALTICDEWISRGYKDTVKQKLMDLPGAWQVSYGLTYEKPKWLGDKRFHASHRSNLLRKKKEFYSKYNWSEPDDLPYIWPSKENFPTKELNLMTKHGDK